MGGRSVATPSATRSRVDPGEAKWCTSFAAGSAGSTEFVVLRCSAIAQGREPAWGTLLDAMPAERLRVSRLGQEPRGEPGSAHRERWKERAGERGELGRQSEHHEHVAASG